MKSDTNGMRNSYPATHWYEATPLGNGKIGALVFGNIHEETVAFNQEELYGCVRNKPMPDISSHLNELREMMDRGDYLHANTFYTELLRQKGYDVRPGRFIPAFDLKIIQPVAERFSDYRRELDFEHGICTVRWKVNGAPYSRVSYIHAKPSVFVCEFHAEEKLTNVKISLKERDLLDCVDHLGHDLQPYIQTTSELKDGCFIYLKGICENGPRYGAILKVIADQVSAHNDAVQPLDETEEPFDRMLYDYLLCSGKNIRVLVDVFADDSEEAFRISREKLDSIETDGLRQKHADAFSELYNRCGFDCPSEEDLSNEQILMNCYGKDASLSDVLKLAKYGRYLFISSSMNGSLPSNLQGIWNGSYTPSWNCVFFNNENIEMNYWQAMQGNLCEAMLPLFDLYDRFKEDYRENAKKLYGCKGILLPLFMDNTCGHKKNLSPHVLYWTGSSAWVASLYYDYYRYTGDTDFLLNRALPFMEEAFEFYEDFVVEKDGKWQFYPSNSPENTPNGEFEGAGKCLVCVNATMDFALTKELATNLLSIQENFVGNKKQIARLQSFLSKIPPYEINEDGAIREWMHPDMKDHYQHRHISHIYPLFPGTEITEEENPELFHSMDVALDKRMVIGLKAQTGWSLSHVANAFTRLHHGEKSIGCIRDLFRFCLLPNFFTLHNDWRRMGCTLSYLARERDPIFQIESNLGVTSAILEMLVYSNDSRIHIFSAKPAEWDEGKFHGILARGGVEISAEWNRERATITFVPHRNCERTVCVCGYFFDNGEKSRLLKFEENKRVVLDFYRNESQK